MAAADDAAAAAAAALFSDLSSATADDSSPPDLDPQTLDQLIQSARTPEGRSAALLAGTLATVLRRLSSTPTPLLFHSLLLVRNLVAGDALHQDQFLVSGGPDRVASVLLRSPPVPTDVVRVALQVLGNVSLAGEPHRAAVWERFFPNWFYEMATVQQPGVVDPLCMVLDCCCSGEGGRRRMEELCDEARGLPIVVEIIAAACHAGYQEEWLEWLLCKACVEEPYFSRVFPKLAVNNPTNDDGGFNLISPEQAFLIRTLEKFITTHARDVGRISRDFALGVLKVLRDVSATVDLITRNKLPTDGLALDVLGSSLNTLKTICALENSLPQIVDGAMNSLLSSGLLDVILGLLQELEPPNIIKKSLANSGGQVVQPSAGKKACPYKGYRRDLVSIIANCVHRNKQVQDEIRERGAIPLLLQQCVIDDENPFLREWGLLAVRNLLEGNLENQNEVAEMELKEPVNTPQIAGLGFKVEIDEKSQRPKLVNIQ